MIQLSIDHGLIVVRSPFTAKDIIKGEPGSGARWNKPLRVWTFPATPAMARALVDRIEAAHLECSKSAAVTDLLALDERIRAAQSIKDADVALEPIPITKTQPWRHQVAAYHFMRSLPGVIITMAMGTGKSKVAVDAVVNDGDRRVLIVCPRYVVSVWERQFTFHANDIEVVLLGEGTIEKRARVMAALDKSRAGTVVFVINYEALDRSEMHKAIDAVQWDRIILDEGHRIKSPAGKRSRYLALRAKTIPKKAILTGTPTDNPMDWYALCRFIDPGVLGTSFTAFKARYAIIDPRFKQPLNFINMDDLNKRVGRVVFHVGDDAVELPEARDEHLDFTLSKEEAKIYDEMRINLVAQIKDGLITAANAAVKILRLQQITGGMAPVDDQKAVRIGTSKIDVFKDLLADLDAEPIVVFCRFLADIDAVLAACEEAKIDAVELSGRTTDTYVKWWQGGGSQVLVVQIDAGATGLDLTRARIGVYYSAGFSWISYAQSRKRIHRPGQTRPVIYYHLTARGTVDETVLKVLNRKGATERDFLTDVMKNICEETPLRLL
jgi:SNF2 family DNA or RNA helicase